MKDHFIRSRDEAAEASARKGFRLFRNVIILAYLAAGVALYLLWIRAVRGAEGFTIFLLVIAGGLALAGVILAYLFSLAVALALFAVRVRLWLIVLAAVLAGPGSVALLAWIVRGM